MDHVPASDPRPIGSLAGRPPVRTWQFVDGRCQFTDGCTAVQARDHTATIDAGQSINAYRHCIDVRQCNDGHASVVSLFVEVCCFERARI